MKKVRTLDGEEGQKEREGLIEYIRRDLDSPCWDNLSLMPGEEKRRPFLGNGDDFLEKRRPKVSYRRKK